MLNSKFIFWIIILALIASFLYSISVILTPFIVSILIAYFLDPLTIKIEKNGIKRRWTVSIIVTLFSLTMAIGLLNLIPILFEQIRQFIFSIPKYEDYLSKNVFNNIQNFFNAMDPELGEKIHNHLADSSNKFFEYIMVIINNIFDSSIALLNLIGLIFFTPILVFYLLRDWPYLVKKLKSLLPLDQKHLILDQLKQIDKVLSAYIRGQINVCIILSLFYVICLSILGLNYALLLGIIAGFLVIIPYLGLIISSIICIIISLLQFTELKYAYISFGIIMLGHLLEGYIITPRLVGERIGLHPVWIIFALMTGGALFGFWGMFFAIPIAAILGVVIRSLLKIYLASSLYNDEDKGK